MRFAAYRSSIAGPATHRKTPASPAPSRTSISSRRSSTFSACRFPRLQGRSLLGLERDPAQPSDQPIFIEYNRYEVDHDGFGAFYPLPIFDGRYKLAVNLLDTDELYDLSADPGPNCTTEINSPRRAPHRPRPSARRAPRLDEPDARPDARTALGPPCLARRRRLGLPRPNPASPRRRGLFPLRSSLRHRAARWLRLSRLTP